MKRGLNKTRSSGSKRQMFLALDPIPAVSNHLSQEPQSNGMTRKNSDRNLSWQEQLKQERSSEEGYCHLQISKVPKGFSFFSFLFFPESSPGTDSVVSVG